MKRQLLSAALGLGVLLGGQAQAVVTIDNFATTQTTTATLAGGPQQNTANDFTATDLPTGADRVLRAEVTSGSPGTTATTIQTNSGYLGVSLDNGTTLAVDSVTYQGFGTFGLSAVADRFWLHVFETDADPTVNAAGFKLDWLVTSTTYGTVAYSVTYAVGTLLNDSTIVAPFGSFSGNQLAFSAVTQIQLTFTGDTAFDGLFDNLQAAPLPGTLALIGLGLLGLGRSRRRAN